LRDGDHTACGERRGVVWETAKRKQGYYAQFLLLHTSRNARRQGGGGRSGNFFQLRKF
jgi:hypothetical protein